ncbi:MAG: ABC transporter permease [Acidobacteriia bacterium]|nr:ABC transporter permease [Terriglobia bacterium]
MPTDAASNVAIEIRNVTRVYHAGDVDVDALRGISLAVEYGEFVAIVGSSGSGKSTLMAILGCLDRPTSGQYFFNGVDVAGLSEPDLARVRSERIGFVFQTFNLLARTSAVENVALPLFYSGSGSSRRAVRLARARTALEMVGLGDREANTPAQLSGGQQQRVAIARALINNPSLLLADEPTGNVDTATSHDIMARLVTLNREQGVTVIVVTHEADIAAYADRVITLRDGEIVSDERKPKAARATAAGGAEPRPLTGVPAGTSAAFGFMILGAAVQALRRNMLRSSLTMLGVFIGVAALIAMVAVGQGANDAVKKQIESLGTNLLVVLPGATTATGVRAGSGSAATLTVADAQAIRREDAAVTQISYLNRQMGQVQYANQNWTTQIQGVSPNYPPITNWQIAAGRGFNDEDETSAALVAIIGQTVYHQLFAESENPVGATILVKRVPMRVIGLFVGKGQTPFGQDQDDLVMIPFTTAERKVLGVAAPTQSQTPSNAVYAGAPNPFGLQPRITGKVNSIFVQATRPEDVQVALNQVTETLARRHRIKAGDTNDFSVRNLSQIADVVQSSSRIMALLLATVASISLVVGGIGIMNILLVSVTERTREIGLRMAIGARRLHVLVQFLAEAVFLSVTGGVVGIAAGLAASKVIAAVAGWPTQVPPAAIGGGFLFSAAVGIFFGYYPARKASRLDPIEALRYE